MNYKKKLTHSEKKLLPTSNVALEKSKGCKNCGSLNIYGVSRVVGYYSIIENWNIGKTAELQDRQKGNYTILN